MGMRQFYGECFLSAIKSRRGQVAGIILAILSPISYFLSPLEGAMNNLLWAIPLSVFLGIFLPVLIRAPYEKYRNQARELEKYENPMVELVFDDKIGSCKQVTIYRGTLSGYETIKTIYRVGIRAMGGVTSEDVEVMLIRHSPQDSSFLPQTLNPFRYGEGSEEGKLTIHPSPKPMDFVNVVEWTKGDDQIRIYFQQNYSPTGRKVPNEIPVGQYTFTLGVKGKNMPYYGKDFVVEVKNNELLFYPVEP